MGCPVTLVSVNDNINSEVNPRLEFSFNCELLKDRPTYDLATSNKNVLWFLKHFSFFAVHVPVCSI